MTFYFRLAVLKDLLVSTFLIPSFGVTLLWHQWLFLLVLDHLVWAPMLSLVLLLPVPLSRNGIKLKKRLNFRGQTGSKILFYVINPHLGNFKSLSYNNFMPKKPSTATTTVDSDGTQTYQWLVPLNECGVTASLDSTDPNNIFTKYDLYLNSNRNVSKNNLFWLAIVISSMIGQRMRVRKVGNGSWKKREIETF